jgi:AraC-like DNA-binding protein
LTTSPPDSIFPELKNQGAWLSWLERRVHIAETAGSSPAAPIFSSLHNAALSVYLLIMRQITPALSLLLVWCSITSGDDLSKCLRFEAPQQKSIITDQSCTLGVDSSCKTIYKTEIKVRYFPEDADTAVVKTIGKIYRAPFKQIWDLKEIPNQLFVGVGIIIEVSFADGDVSGLFREGIFLTHKPVTYPEEKAIGYEYPGVTILTGDSTAFPLHGGGWAAVQMYWNEKEIAFRINVNDTSFLMMAPEKVLEQSGVEILLDPTLKRKPYPTDNVMIYVVPLANKSPYRITYKPVWNDSGNFRLNPGSLRSNFDFSIVKNDRKGYTVTFSLPRYLFGTSLPDKMTYNVIVKAADTAGKITTASLIGARGYNNYSPFLWHTIRFAPKPVLKTRWIVWLVSFLSGLLLPVMIYAVSSLFMNDRPVVLHVNRPDEKNKFFQNIKETINLHITLKDISIATISAEIGTPSPKLELTIKKVTGMSFKNYVMYLRTEIVCERLRSSHSSEVSIAETCGFKNVNEMERFFQKFHHTTPYNFRKTQQITQLQ